MPKSDSLKQTFQQLKRHCSALRREHQLDSDTTAFSYWFCQATLADPDDDDAVRRSLVGNKNDRNVDIFFASPTSQTVFLAQTKYRGRLLSNSERLNDVKALAHLVASFAKPQEDFIHDLRNADHDVQTDLANAWRLVRHQDYRVRAIFATTGKISTANREEAESIITNLRTSTERAIAADYLFYDGRDCCRLYADYEDLVPAIPFIDFACPSHQRFRVANKRNRIASYLFPTQVTTIRGIFNAHRERLFARNVRLSKGDSTPTNSEIRATLDRFPEEFFYLNNGITILANRVQVTGESTLRIYGPQIINGQQTTRMIAKQRGPCDGAEVLIKIIAKEADSDEELQKLRQFVHRVVRSTNFQNPIKLSELAANNVEQVRLERAFRHEGWRYIRKRGRRDDSDFGWKGAKKPFHCITLQELTTALVACEHDPHFIRAEGIESLFENVFHEQNDALYWRLFAEEKKISDYMFAGLCYWLARCKTTKPGTIPRTYENFGEYYIAFRIHEELLPLYRADSSGLLRKLGSQSYKFVQTPPLRAIRKSVGQAWHGFVRANIGNLPIGSFISTRASKTSWDRFWRSSHARLHRKTCMDSVAILRD